MFRLCRYCGDELSRARAPLEICARCEDSPLCDRCGHPRRDHTRVFARRNAKGCKRVVGDFQSLTSWQCECEGFRPVVGALADAAFAAPDAPGRLPPLRLAEPRPS
jgi:hypothetical protein